MYTAASTLSEVCGFAQKGRGIMDFPHDIMQNYIPHLKSSDRTIESVPTSQLTRLNLNIV